MATGKNINDSALQKVTDFTNLVNRLYASATSSTKDGYIVLKELIDYIVSQGGGGDMLKSVYDAIDDGVVNDSRLINGDTVANDSAVALNTAKKTSLWQIITNKLSNILQTVDYLSLFAKNVEVVRIGDGVNPKVIVDPAGTFGSTTGYWFSNGDTGIHESSDDLLSVHIAGSIKWQFSGGNLQGVNSNSPFMSAANSGSPTLVNIGPSKADTDTGLGRAGANELSLIAGGVEVFRGKADGAYIQVIKSGATQVAAGANPGEMWKTLGHATLPDNVILHGV